MDVAVEQYYREVISAQQKAFGYFGLFQSNVKDNLANHTFIPKAKINPYLKMPYFCFGKSNKTILYF